MRQEPSAHANRLAHSATLLIVLSAFSTACQRDTADEDPPDAYPDCGEYAGNHFLVNQLAIGIDPIDFAGESWDWDGQGIGDFWERYGALVDALLWVATEGGYQPGSSDWAFELADEFAPLLLSPYVSPDLTMEWFWWDGHDATYVDAIDNHDNETVMVLAPFELEFSSDESGWYIDMFDRDIAFDDYAGWMYLDGPSLRGVADCGPLVFVFQDATMDEYDTRVRFFVLDVESW